MGLLERYDYREDTQRGNARIKTVTLTLEYLPGQYSGPRMRATDSAQRSFTNLCGIRQTFKHCMDVVDDIFLKTKRVVYFAKQKADDFTKFFGGWMSKISLSDCVVEMIFTKKTEKTMDLTVDVVAIMNGTTVTNGGTVMCRLSVGYVLLGRRERKRKEKGKNQTI